jgi:hypothetical protein
MGGKFLGSDSSKQALSRGSSKEGGSLLSLCCLWGGEARIKMHWTGFSAMVACFDSLRREEGYWVLKKGLLAFWGIELWVKSGGMDF